MTRRASDRQEDESRGYRCGPARIATEHAAEMLDIYADATRRAETRPFDIREIAGRDF